MAKHHAEPDSPETRQKRMNLLSLRAVSLRSVEIIEGLPELKME